MKLGDIEIQAVVENKFKLDGGSMFGVIPKSLWSKLCRPDENNLVDMDINPMIVKTGRDILILDTGFGDTLNERQTKIYGLTQTSRWENILVEESIKPEQVTGVILTHAHADHAMGAFKRGHDGSVQLRFPNAKYYIQKREWQDAMNPNERTAATYIVEKLRLLEDSGKLVLLEGDTELFPGVSVKVIGGHTPGMQAILIDGGGQRVIYPGDLMPMAAHIKIPYVAAVDLDPITTMNQKRWLHEKMLKEDWIIAFDHDRQFKLAKFRQDENGKIVPVGV
ncbi:MAG: MBL fold metallo-hydrolase [candidate division Zixibacteria bacterium]|jgi:glyoxylase-like metal-dependent hydrolase (beta-lactamase superfamily II)|nr:MBL fold metallo-hydrolase [candidate division Zixibacteria bacterium]